MSFISTRDPQALPISEADLRKFVPSIFAVEAHESRSDRYTYIPTIDILNGLRKEGFDIVRAQQSRTRDASKREFTKHMIRFRHRGTLAPRAVGDVFPEVVLVNSHDGTSAYQISAGLFRLACLNGMVVADGTIDCVKVPHKGDVLSQVVQGSMGVLGQTGIAIEAAGSWRQIEMSRDERGIFADAVRTLRFGDAEGNVDTPITAEQLLIPRRVSDQPRDLWTTFNVAQENVIRGGVTAEFRDPTTGRRRRTTTREVKGIDADVKLNKALWTLAEKMAELKGFRAAAA